MAMRKLSVRLLFVVLLAGGVLAWSQATTGSISGHVTDPAGNVLQGAQVAIHEVDTGIDYHSHDRSVRGIHLDRATARSLHDQRRGSGFATATIPAFELNIDQKARFNIPMKVGAVTSNVEVVTDSAPILQLQGAETGQVIGGREIEDLPLEGRNFTGLMKLVPGVERRRRRQQSEPLRQRTARIFKFREINGTEVTGNRNNDTNVVPSPDALQEFKMVTSAYAPEFGRASGGSVLIQTKSGTNNYHGSAYFFYRPTATAANNTFAARRHHAHSRSRKSTAQPSAARSRKTRHSCFSPIEGNRLQNSYSYFGNTPPVNQVTFDSSRRCQPLRARPTLTPETKIPIFDPVFFNNNYYSEQFPGNIIPANQGQPGGQADSAEPIPHAGEQQLLYQLCRSAGLHRQQQRRQPAHGLHVLADRTAST